MLRRLSLSDLLLPGWILLPLLLMMTGCSNQGTSPVPTARVMEGPFEVTLTVSGELKAVNSVKVVAPGLRGGNKIVELAEAGSMVKKGDVVCRFDINEATREKDTTEAELALADQKVAQLIQENSNNLANLERGVTQAQLSLDQAMLGKTESDTVSRIEKERTRIEIVQATISLEKAKQDLDSARATGEGNVESLRLEVKKLRNQQTEIEESLQKAVIQAPTDGLVILGKTWRGGIIAEGDEVWGGQTLMELPDLTTMEVKGYVHEVDAAQVKAGQTSIVRLDTFPDRTFTGKVKKVADLATTRSEDSKIKYFEVTIELDKTDSVMKPGMTAKIDLLLERIDKALFIPREALQEGGDGMVTWVKVDGAPVSRPVEPGKRNATHVVLLKGVTKGEEVYLGDPTKGPGEQGPTPSPTAKEPAPTSPPSGGPPRGGGGGGGGGRPRGPRGS